MKVRGNQRWAALKARLNHNSDHRFRLVGHSPSSTASHCFPSELCIPETALDPSRSLIQSQRRSIFVACTQDEPERAFKMARLNGLKHKQLVPDQALCFNPIVALSDVCIGLPSDSIISLSMRPKCSSRGVKRVSSIVISRARDRTVLASAASKALIEPFLHSNFFSFFPIV